MIHAQWPRKFQRAEAFQCHSILAHKQIIQSMWITVCLSILNDKVLIMLNHYNVTNNCKHLVCHLFHSQGQLQYQALLKPMYYCSFGKVALINSMNCGNLTAKENTSPPLTISPAYKKFSLALPLLLVCQYNICIWWYQAREYGTFVKFIHFFALKKPFLPSNLMHHKCRKGPYRIIWSGKWMR